MINITNLTKTYRTDLIETTAVNDLSLTVETGEFVSIMGPSGCGKSTLLNIIGLLDDFNGGSYRFLDQEVSGYNVNQKASLRKENIGFIFQNFNLIDELSVAANIELPLRYQKIDRKLGRERVEEVMARMQIDHRAKHYPAQLSGGQQQRVAIARALVTQPSLLLADEPTGNLDSTNGDEVLNLLASLHDTGSTIIMVTHSEHDAAQSSRIIRLKDGRIAEPQIA